MAGLSARLHAVWSPNFGPSLALQHHLPPLPLLLGCRYVVARPRGSLRDCCTLRRTRVTSPWGVSSYLTNDNTVWHRQKLSFSIHDHGCIVTHTINYCIWEACASSTPVPTSQACSVQVRRAYSLRTANAHILFHLLIPLMRRT